MLLKRQFLIEIKVTDMHKSEHFPLQKKNAESQFLSNKQGMCAEIYPLYSKGGDALAQAARGSCDCPKVLRAKVNGALGSLIKWVTTLPVAGGWNWVVSNVPSSIKPFNDSLVS